MKLSSFFPTLLIALLPGLGLARSTAQGATNTPGARALTQSVPDAVPSVPDVPKSVFTVPRTPQEGRDPFFPNSSRLFAASILKPVAATTAAAPNISDLMTWTAIKDSYLRSRVQASAAFALKGWSGRRTSRSAASATTGTAPELANDI